MFRFTVWILALALGAAAAVALVSCGGDTEGLLPGQSADEIVSNLNQVEQDAVNGDCASAQSAADEVRQQIDDLGGDVNTQLKARLRDGAARLQQLVSTTCEEDTATTPTVEPTTTEKTTTEKTTTKSTTTTTTSTAPTIPTTTTTPTTTTGAPTGGTPGGGGIVPPGTG